MPIPIRYPWDAWFRCEQFQLRRLTDFSCRPYTMAVQVRAAAAKRGLRVSVFITGNVLSVTVRRG